MSAGIYSQEIWKKTWWRWMPMLPRRGLRQLLEACQNDNSFLIQGRNTEPWDGSTVVNAACPVAFVLMASEPAILDVPDLEDAFALSCCQISDAIGEPAGCRWFLNWWDEGKREDVLPALAHEIEEYLALDEITGDARDDLPTP